MGHVLDLRDKVTSNVEGSKASLQMSRQCAASQRQDVIR
jgi:hypothetical protein